MTKTLHINDLVKVKLTEFGRNVHRSKYEWIYKHTGEDYVAPVEDVEGYSLWLFWRLMETFGTHMKLDGDQPFEATIILETAND